MWGRRKEDSQGFSLEQYLCSYQGTMQWPYTSKGNSTDRSIALGLVQPDDAGTMALTMERSRCVLPIPCIRLEDGCKRKSMSCPDFTEDVIWKTGWLLRSNA